MTTTFKDVLARKGLKLGHYVGEFATPGIGYVLKEAGCDFVWLDMEHSGLGFETVHRTLRYFEAADLPAMVRLPSGAYDHVARALDVGADAIVVPMLGSAEQARAIVQRMKYTPDGGRGVALGLANDRYRQGPVLNALAAANRRTAFVALIETKDGIANVDEIAATPGVDVLWVGHFDLTCDMGIPGAFDHPDYLAALDKVKRAGKRAGKPIGRLVGDVAGGVALAQDGWDLIIYSGDVWLLQAAVRDGLEQIRAGAKAKKAKPAKDAKPKKKKGG
ncbi:MAG: hpch/hpai aldolase [Geminicoccaceae bacterium]|nr:MAG: hpch/hpai aldolase [Geminicoccaceae bacterium]